MKSLDCGTMPIKKLMGKLAIPAIITAIVGSLNMVIDGIFTGRFIGSDALVAVNLVVPIVMIIFALTDIVAAGAGVRMEVLLGAKKQKEASRVFSVSVIMIFAMGIVTTMVAMFFAKDLIFFLIKDKALAILVYDYAKVFIVAIPFMAHCLPLMIFCLCVAR